jgi:ubiquitin C-terminal hydrolase
MNVHEPIDNVRSTNQLLYYSSPKTSEDAHEFIMALQKFLLDELENSEKNPGHTVCGEVYDNYLYVSMKAFRDLFTGEITHEYTCTSCKNTSENQESIDYLLLKFPDEHHECDLNCTVEYLIKHHLQEEKLMTISAGFAIELLQQ